MSLPNPACPSIPDPQFRLDLNAQRALGQILDRRAWWLASPSECAQWIDELDEMLVRINLYQVLSIWKNYWIRWTFLVPEAMNAVALPVGSNEKRVAVNAVFKEIIERIHTFGYFCIRPEDSDSNESEGQRDDDVNLSDDGYDDDTMKGDDDTDDAMALDKDDHVVSFDVAMDEAREWLRQQGYNENDLDEIDEVDDVSMDDFKHPDDLDDPAMRYKHENPFGWIAWFVHLVIVREQLLALGPDDAMPEETIQTILELGPTPTNELVTTRTVSLILTAIHSNDTFGTMTAYLPDGDIPDNTLDVLHFSISMRSRHSSTKPSRMLELCWRLLPRISNWKPQKKL